MGPAEFRKKEKEELWRLREHFVTKVGRELDLIGQRVTWLVTSQAFLFNAWVAARDKGRYGLALDVCIIGIAIAVPAFFAVCGALRVLHRMGEHYLDAIEIVLGLPPMGANREEPNTMRWGNWPALFLPSMFAGTWAGAAMNIVWPAYPWHLQLGTATVPVDVRASGIGMAIVLSGTVSARYFWARAKGPAQEKFPLSPVLQSALDFVGRQRSPAKSQPPLASLSSAATAGAKNSSTADELQSVHTGRPP